MAKAILTEKIYQKAIKQAIKDRMNIMIVGAAGVGKTTLVNEIINETKYLKGYNLEIVQDYPEIKKKRKASKSSSKTAYILNELRNQEDMNQFLSCPSDVCLATIHSANHEYILVNADAIRKTLIIQMDFFKINSISVV